MENRIKKNIEPKKKRPSKKGMTLKKLISLDNYLDKGSIEKQLPFLAFLFLLGVLYIWNGHYQTRTIREIEGVNSKIKKLKWEKMTAKSELMNMGKQTELAKRVDSLGLKELKTPPTILYVD